MTDEQSPFEWATEELEAMANDDLIQAFGRAVVDTLDGSSRDWATREAIEHELLRRLAKCAALDDCVVSSKAFE